MSSLLNEFDFRIFAISDLHTNKKIIQDAKSSRK